MQILSTIILLHAQMLMLSVIATCFVLVVIARGSNHFAEQAIAFVSIAALSAIMFLILLKL